MTYICGQVKEYLIFGKSESKKSFSKFQLCTKNDSILSSSEVSLGSSNSPDSFSNFHKLKSCGFEPTVRDNENTCREVSSPTMQRKEAEKEQKGNIE